MGKASSRKRYARASSLRTRRRTSSGATWFRLSTAVIVILGTMLVVVSRNDRAGAKSPPPLANKDHWHAALGINICGTWQPNVPAYEGNGGVHSHGEGLMHIHPFDAAHAGHNANIGVFLLGAGDKLSSTSIKLNGQKRLSNGDRCSSLKKDGVIRWVVNGKERTGSGNPAKYAPKNGDYITVAFVPKNYDFNLIREPNNRHALDNISDLAPTTSLPTGDTGSTAPGTPTSTPPTSTTPTTAVTATSTPTTTK